METKYFVNKEKGVVVCRITECYSYTQATYIGIARCLPEDTFDEEIGKRIANTRAHIEMHRDIMSLETKEANRYGKKYFKAIQEVNRTYKKIQGLKSKLYKMTGKEVKYPN